MILIETVPFLICGIWVFLIVLLYCEFGQRVADQFVMFDEGFERCDWNVLPMNMQRIYLIFLSDTQQTKYITCYFNLICTRGTFQSVCMNMNTERISKS